jgi:hypothetical protein
MKKERNDEKAASEIINVIFIGLESRLCLSLHSNPIPFAEFPLKLAPRGGVDDTRQNVDLFWGMEMGNGQLLPHAAALPFRGVQTDRIW